MESTIFSIPHQFHNTVLYVTMLMKKKLEDIIFCWVFIFILFLEEFPYSAWGIASMFQINIKFQNNEAKKDPISVSEYLPFSLIKTLMSVFSYTI